MAEPIQNQRIPDLHFGLNPVQMGDQIIVQISVADNFGLSINLNMPPTMARQFSKAIKDAVETAETMIVKPPSLIHQA